MKIIYDNLQGVWKMKSRIKHTMSKDSDIMSTSFPSSIDVYEHHVERAYRQDIPTLVTFTIPKCLSIGTTHNYLTMSPIQCANAILFYINMCFD